MRRADLADLSLTVRRHSSADPSNGSGRQRTAGIVLVGSVSERPKEHASKACEGATPPWVQIPPLPPQNRSPDAA